MYPAPLWFLLVLDGALASASTKRGDTNASRFARGLPPLPPKRAWKQPGSDGSEKLDRPGSFDSIRQVKLTPSVPDRRVVKDRQ